MRLLVCSYDGSKIAATREFTNGVVQTRSNRWTCDLRELPVAGEPGARDLTVTFRLVDGAAKSAGVAVAFDFGDWSRSNYVLVPGVVYNGNRFPTLGSGYMPAFPREMFFNPKLPLTISDNPRLSSAGKGGEPRILIGRESIPWLTSRALRETRGRAESYLMLRYS